MGRRRRRPYDWSYDYWFCYFFNKLLNIFTWNGLPFGQEQIERMCIRQGYAGVVLADNGEWVAATGSLYGVTNYPNVYTRYVYATPLISGDVAVDGSNFVQVSNTLNLVPSLMIVQRYADLAAHIDLTFKSYVINTRATAILAAPNDMVAQSVQAFYNKLEDGELGAIVDPDQLTSLINAQGLRQVASSYPSTNALPDIMTAHHNLLRQFYADIGFNMTPDKRERVITDEISQDDVIVDFNVHDMLRCRESAAADMSVKMGIDITVRLTKQVVSTQQTQVPMEEDADDYNSEIDGSGVGE